MTMRAHQLVTHLRPEDAYTLIEFLDQLRALLMDAYGEEVTAMLQQASPHSSGERSDDPF